MPIKDDLIKLEKCRLCKRIVDYDMWAFPYGICDHCHDRTGKVPSYIPSEQYNKYYIKLYKII